MRKYLLHTSFLAIIACLLWSSAFTGVKIGLQYSSPLRFAGIRFFWAGVLLLPFALKSGNLLHIIKNNFLQISIIALLQIIIQYIFFYKGLELVQGSVGAIVIGSGPLIVAILTHFFMNDDRLSLKKIVVIVLGLCGILLVILGKHPEEQELNVSFLGIFFLILVNISSGMANIYIKRTSSQLPPLAMSSTTMILGGAVIYFISIPYEGFEFSVKPIEYYYALLWLIFLSASAFSIWFYLLKRPGVKVSYLNFWKFLIPVVGAVLAWLILPDESPNIYSVTGVVITGVALILLNVLRRKEAAINAN